MGKEEFEKLISDLDDRDAARVLAYLSGYYSKNEEFMSAVLSAIESIKKTKINWILWGKGAKELWVIKLYVVIIARVHILKFIFLKSLNDSLWMQKSMT